LNDSERVLDVEEFEAKINVQGLVLNLFTFMFLGTTDWFQGAAVRDNSADNPVWDWIIWDLDHSFRDKERQKREDKYGTLTEEFLRTPWEQPAFALVAKKDAHGRWKRSYTRRSVRSDLFIRLLNDDPNFARFFLNTVSELLNHKLTKEYIGTLFEKYSTFAENIPYSESIQESIGKKMEFLKNRPDFVRLRLAQIFDVPKIYNVSVVGSNTFIVDIDGYSEKPGYQGKYFSGGDLSIRANSDYNLKYWIVNGRVVHDKHLKLIVNSDVLVEPVFVEP
jgi:hypothetical protein